MHVNMYARLQVHTPCIGETHSKQYHMCTHTNYYVYKIHAKHHVYTHANHRMYKIHVKSYRLCGTEVAACVGVDLPHTTRGVGVLCVDTRDRQDDTNI